MILAVQWWYMSKTTSHRESRQPPIVPEKIDFFNCDTIPNITRYIGHAQRNQREAFIQHPNNDFVLVYRPTEMFRRLTRPAGVEIRKIKDTLSSNDFRQIVETVRAACQLLQIDITFSSDVMTRYFTIITTPVENKLR